MTVKFNLLRPKDKTGKLRTEPVSIQVIVCNKGSRVELSTGLKIIPKFWGKGEAKTSLIEHDSINTELDSLKKRITEAWKLNKFVKSPELNALVQKAIDNVQEQPVQKKTSNFEKYIIEFIEKNRKFKLRKKATIDSFQQTFDHLSVFCTDNDIELTFEAVTLDFYYGFTAFLWDDMGMTDNTVGKHIKNLKTLLQESFDEDLHSNIVFKKKKFKKPSFKADNVYLTADEIVKIYSTDLSDNKTLAVHRDLFVFNCWVGVRFGDLCNIRPEQIRQMSDGKYLQLITEKTGEDVTIPFHPLAEAIYSHYNNKLPKLQKGESVVYNRHLKTICELAKINTVSRKVSFVRGTVKAEFFPKHELVSAHTARRSFATNCYKMGNPTITIMAITGHKTEKAFMRYICVTKEEHAQRMMKTFNEAPITTGDNKAIMKKLG
jgi:integrase